MIASGTTSQAQLAAPSGGTAIVLESQTSGSARKPARSHFDREEAALIEIGHTDFSRGVPWFLLVAVLASFLVVPCVQTIHDLREYRDGRRASAVPQCLEIFQAVPKSVKAFARGGKSLLGRFLALSDSFHDDIARYEQRVKDDNVVVNTLLPPTQVLLLGWLGAGNEKAYAGLDGWLYYRPDIDYLTARGFLDPRQFTKRRHSGDRWTPAPQPDPVKAIVQFKEQLARRGIQLVLLPAPAKSMLEPEMFSSRYAQFRPPLRNPSFTRFKDQLVRAGVLVVDPTEMLLAAKSASDAPQYLQTDTHWTPEAVELVAAGLKDVLTGQLKLPPATPAGYQRSEAQITNLGDIAMMLKLPPDQQLYHPQRVRVSQVVSPDGGLWRPDKSSDVLLLGDSFANIYSLEGMGWGESAGLAEQLSFELQRPLDVILRNDSGAFATREILSRELVKGRERLAGKKVVIWEFAMRELAFGDWKLLPMELGQRAPRKFIVPPVGKELIVSGIIESIAAAPKPGSVPYKDHIVAAHLVELESDYKPVPGGEAVVYLWSMRDNVWTPAARYRPGQRIQLKLRAWAEVSEKLERINRNELKDESLQLEEPCWGEIPEQ